jgi:hypothetical protein
MFARMSRNRTAHSAAVTTAVPPATPDRLCRTLLPNSSLTSRAASSPHGCPGPSTPPTTRGRPAPAPPARPPSRSPGSPASHQRTRLPRPPPPPGKSPGPPGRMYGNARSTQRLTSSRNTRPARPVRGRPRKADGVHTGRPSGWTPSAICPWTPRRRDLQRYKRTHDGTEKKRPA